MSNPFFQPMGAPSAPRGPMGNMMQLMQQFQQFRQTFHGDPQKTVEEMLQSGKITQEQLQQAQQMARQLGFLK